MNIGIKIKYLRTRHNLTQAQLADALSVTDKAISKWELGSSWPFIDMVVDIANYFDVSLDFLLRDKDSDKYLLNDYDCDYQIVGGILPTTNNIDNEINKERKDIFISKLKLILPQLTNMVYILDGDMVDEYKSKRIKEISYKLVRSNIYKQVNRSLKYYDQSINNIIDKINSLLKSIELVSIIEQINNLNSFHQQLLEVNNGLYKWIMENENE